MYTKLGIFGDICIITGLHIGANDAFSAIGGVDSPVVRDPYTQRPIIPGSSLKGKMRTLLSRALSDALVLQGCDSDPEQLKQLFGANTGGGDDGKGMIKAHLIFSDAQIINAEDFKDIGLTESKFENNISRATGIAEPRQIERVVPGVRFQLHLVYDVDDVARLKSDFELIALGLKLLSYDYLGGHGTRGSGRIRFENLCVKPLLKHDAMSDDVIQALNEVLQAEVPSYENNI